MRYRLAPKTILVSLLWCIATLSVLHLGAMIASRVFGFSYLFGLISLFDLNSEQNLPTLFSSVLLLACGASSWTSARLAQAMRFAWYALAAVFAVMAVSETAALHEPVFFVMKGNVSPRTAMMAEYLPTFSALMPVLVPLSIAVAFVVAKFLMHLDGQARGLFIVAATLYLGGAVGLDEVTAATSQGPVADTWTHMLIASAEEVLEMLGATVFLFASLERLARRYPGSVIELAFGQEKGEKAPS